MTSLSEALPLTIRTFGVANALAPRESREGLLADVLPELAALEVDALHALVGALDRSLEVVADAGHGANAPAGRDDLSVLHLGARMENVEPFVHLHLCRV